MQPARWFWEGSAERFDGGQEHAPSAQARLGDDAKLPIVFCSPSLDLSALLRRMGTSAGLVPLIGCSTARTLIVLSVA